MKNAPTRERMPSQKSPTGLSVSFQHFARLLRLDTKSNLLNVIRSMGQIGSNCALWFCRAVLEATLWQSESAKP